MRLFRLNSVVQKILLPANLLAAVLMLALAGWMLSRQVESSRREIAGKVGSRQAFLANASSTYIINFALAALEQFARQTVKDADFDSLEFLELAGRPRSYVPYGRQIQRRGRPDRRSAEFHG